MKGRGGISGEWLEVWLPEAVILSSFTMTASSTQSIPRSFKILGSVDSISFDLLGEYTDVSVATTAEGTIFKFKYKCIYQTFKESLGVLASSLLELLRFRFRSVLLCRSKL